MAATIPPWGATASFHASLIVVANRPSPTTSSSRSSHPVPIAVVLPDVCAASRPHIGCDPSQTLGRPGDMGLRWQCVCIDCADPASLGRWWADLLGWRVTLDEPDEVVIEPPAGSPEDGVSPDLLFVKVPEAK